MFYNLKPDSLSVNDQIEFPSVTLLDDHSRVGLKVRKDSPAGHDYINASFIDVSN